MIWGRQSLAVEREAENQSCLQQEETYKEQLALFHLVTPGLKLKTDERVADIRGGVRPPQLFGTATILKVDHLCPCDSCAPPQRGVQ